LAYPPVSNVEKRVFPSGLTLTFRSSTAAAAAAAAAAADVVDGVEGGPAKEGDVG